LNAKETGLPKNSVVNVSAIMTINRSRFDGFICEIDASLLFMVDNGIRLALDV